MGGKDLYNKWFWRNWIYECKKKSKNKVYNLHKNVRWSKDQDVKCNAIQPPGDNRREV